LKPGERILEKPLAKQLEISRTPVREALLKLQRDGLVICNSRRSYKVRVLGVADVKEIYATLSIIESAAIGLASTRIASRDVQMLRNYNRQAERAARSGDLEGFGAANRNFHGVFLSKLENRTLRDLCDSVRALLYTFPVRPSSLTKWLKKSVREHREIIRLTEAGDRKALES
jgi:DNA-binding GntR family transcriptional regulator